MEKAGTKYWWGAIFVLDKYAEIKQFVCPVTITSPHASARPYLNALSIAAPGIETNGNAWQYTAYGINAYETGGYDTNTVTRYLKSTRVSNASNFLVLGEALFGDVNTFAPYAKMSNSNTGCVLFPHHSGTDTNLLKGDGHAETLKGQGADKSTIIANWYSAGGAVGSYNTDNNAWTYNGKARNVATY